MSAAKSIQLCFGSTDCCSSFMLEDISVTSHSSTLRALLDVLDHPHKKLETAEVIPLVIKATCHSKEQVKEEEKEKNSAEQK